MAALRIFSIVASFLLISFVSGEEKCRITRDVVAEVTGQATIKCKFQILKTDVEMSMTLKTCREEPKVSASLDVNALGIHLKKEGDASIKIPITELGSVEVKIVFL